MRIFARCIVGLALVAWATVAWSESWAVVGLAQGQLSANSPPSPITPAVVDLTLGAPMRVAQELPTCGPVPTCISFGAAASNPGMFAPDLDGRRAYQVNRSFVAGVDGEIIEIDVPSRSYGRRLSLPGMSSATIAAHPLRSWLVGVGGGSTGRTVVLIDTAKFEVAKTVALPAADAGDVESPVPAVPVFSPDGAYVFVGTGNRLYKLDAVDGHVLDVSVTGFAVSPRFDPWRSWIWTVDSDGHRVLAYRSDTLEPVVELTRWSLPIDITLADGGRIVITRYPEDDEMSSSPLIESVDLSGAPFWSFPLPSGNVFYPGGPSAFLYLRIGGGFAEYSAVDFAMRQQWTVGTKRTTTIAFLPQPALAVEYYHASLDHYFLTADADEIDGLDRGAFTGWQRTGERFAVMRSDAGTSGADIPVCRFYGLPSHGLDSHFYTASPTECDAVEHGYDGAWLKERADAFYVVRANESSGACPEGTAPVYRLWNARFDSNHRYTTSAAIKAEMIARGYVPEGAGPDRVAFCARP